MVLSILSRQLTNAAPEPQNFVQGIGQFAGSAFGAAAGSFARETFGRDLYLNNEYYWIIYKKLNIIWIGGGFGRQGFGGPGFGGPGFGGPGIGGFGGYGGRGGFGGRYGRRGYDRFRRGFYY